MTFLKVAAFGAIVFLGASISSAQQKFPLRSGEWEASISSDASKAPPKVILLCLNDELWLKAMSQSPSCSMQKLSSSARGASYSMDCPMQAFQMKGKVDVSFLGMEHMTARASMDITLNGIASHSTISVNYRYKGSTCNPEDVNLQQNQPD
jgi:hypothetical protein